MKINSKRIRNHIVKDAMGIMSKIMRDITKNQGHLEKWQKSLDALAKVDLESARYSVEVGHKGRNTERAVRFERRGLDGLVDEAREKYIAKYGTRDKEVYLSVMLVDKKNKWFIPNKFLY